MKTATQTIVTLCIALIMGACTCNNGDIGNWFGTWHVASITIDGEKTDSNGSDYFFQFQSTVFRAVQVKEHEEAIESYGTWEESGQAMTVTFPDPAVFYIQMPGLEAANAFTVTGGGSGKATFSKTCSDGKHVVYQLEKQP